MLKISKLNAYYDTIPALKGISIDVPKGKIVSIIGANGAGKSTLLKVISGLVQSKNGQIVYQGNNIANLSPDKIVRYGIAQVPEGRQIFIHLSVKDNIHLGAFLYYKRRNKNDINNRIKHVYEMFPILEKRSQQIAGTLSGGEQQMLAIARALMCKPELLLLDEPSMGIAPIIVQEILAVIKQLNKSGTTILLVEQNAKAALEIANHSYVLENGEIALEGLAQELINNPKVKKAYLGG
ncbi:MAG: ABC transporter ATP-binding protein [Deltaproteobacteria bacterium]|nr:ABC transporter ATP-binding protein [Deltaproteobacteria bacterium]MBW2179407.1 ABC transporter ATP-binding protein [Deltaproteobacteria bacterium]